VSRPGSIHCFRLSVLSLPCSVGPGEQLQVFNLGVSAPLARGMYVFVRLHRELLGQPCARNGQLLGFGSLCTTLSFL
jgi:hypothetical protein